MAFVQCVGLFYLKKVLDIFPPLCYNGSKGANRPGAFAPVWFFWLLVRFGSCFGGFLVGCVLDTGFRIKPTEARFFQVHGFTPLSELRSVAPLRGSFL